MLTDIAASNTNDVMIAILTLVGVVAASAGGLVAAWASVRAMRGSHAAREIAERTEAQITSPNGEKSGDAIYEIRKQVIDLVVASGALAAGQHQHEQRLVEHDERDALRFKALFDAGGITDPVGPP